MPEAWQFSPRALKGHRDRLGLSRGQLGAKVGVSPYAIKNYELGLHRPLLEIFLHMCGSLGISPTELCQRIDEDPELVYERALYWSPPPSMLTRRS